MWLLILPVVRIAIVLLLRLFLILFVVSLLFIGSSNCLILFRGQRANAFVMEWLKAHIPLCLIPRAACHLEVLLKKVNTSLTVDNILLLLSYVPRES